jgi:RNA polymerase sigma-70 factor (ECF subfamily)
MVPVRMTSEAERPSAAARMQALYQVHAKPLYRFLLGLTFGERQAAEDMLQETMLRAWRNIEDLNANIATLRPWLVTVARRVAIDAGRARHARPAEVNVVDLTGVPADDDAIEGMLAAETIRQALTRLSPEHRRAIIEVYYHGRSAAEAARLLGVPEGTVRSRIYYALRALRAGLAPAHAPGERASHMHGRGVGGANRGGHSGRDH